MRVVHSLLSALHFRAFSEQLRAGIGPTASRSNSLMRSTCGSDTTYSWSPSGGPWKAYDSAADAIGHQNTPLPMLLRRIDFVDFIRSPGVARTLPGAFDDHFRRRSRERHSIEDPWALRERMGRINLPSFNAYYASLGGSINRA